MHTTRDKSVRQTIDWQQLLVDAVTKQGIVSDAYTAFWNYSIGNMIWAHIQRQIRSIEPGPIHTFRGWQKHGRHVRRGERALTLIMPVTLKRKSHASMLADVSVDTSADQDDRASTFKTFIERPYWFTLSQTEGEPYTPIAVPNWNEELALYTLGITREGFTHSDGNCQGYAHGRNVAVSPVAFLPHRTLLHEVAHVILGHTEEVLGMSDTDTPTPKDLREVEAECVAMLCSCSLGLPGEEFSRGYIQHWYKSDIIPDRSVQRIFKVADAILKAGVPPILPAEADAPVA